MVSTTALLSIVDSKAPHIQVSLSLGGGGGMKRGGWIEGYACTLMVTQRQPYCFHSPSPLSCHHIILSKVDTT